MTDQQDQWIKKQKEEGYFTNDTEYIHDIIRKDQAQKDSLLQSLSAIQKGMDNRVSKRFVSDIIKSVEAKMKANRRLLTI